MWSLGGGAGLPCDDFVEQMPACLWSMCPCSQACDGFINRLTLSDVRPGHPRKYPRSIALHHVDVTGCPIVA